MELKINYFVEISNKGLTFVQIGSTINISIKKEYEIMKLSKILALVLAIVMVISAAACDLTTWIEEDTTTNETGESSSTTTNGTNEESDIENTVESDSETVTDEVPTDDEEPTDKEEIKVITIAEALELCGEPGNITTERYYIRAIIKSITNPQYGQMIITDSTGEISVYGTYSFDGELNYSQLTEKPYKGDEVLLHCILQNYNGTKEVKNARLIEFKSNQGDIDVSTYTSATIAEARNAAEGAKLKVSGIVARITYANGMKPNGFILVDGADSIYVYDGDAAARVAIGNRIEIAASKTYWILADEQNNAATHGYKGCNQLESVTLISNDEGNNQWMSNSIPTSTVKEIMDNPVSNDITTQIYKVTAIVNKVPGSGFVNYYINDLDGKTGSYTYTQCNGSDFAWLDAFDGKICTVYLAVLNAKSTNAGCVYRLLPVAVIDENYVFNTDNTAEHAVKYYGAVQFEKLYTGNPALELVTSVSSELLGFENATLTYASSDESVISITTANGKTIMNCLASGTATITVKGTYNGKEYSETVTVNVNIPTEEIPSITVNEAIEANVGEVVTVKGIVGPSLVNQTGFYLIDETGVIAVVLSEDELAKVQLGHEVILKGKRAIRLKDGSTVFGQTNLDACEILVNNYGSHDYSTATFIEGKTPQYFYDLNAYEDHTTEVYVITATVTVEEAQYYSNIYVTSGSTKIRLYCSSAGQYSWLKAYAGQEVTIEIAACNWNAKNYYTGCVLAVRNADGTKTFNELNFSK